MARTRDDDLFKDTTMTFGEHLEELRSALFKALIGLAIGSGIGLLIGRDVVKIMEAPLLEALKRYYQNQSNEQYAAFLVEHGIPPDPHEDAATAEKRAEAEAELKKKAAELVAREMLFEIRYFDPDQLREALQSAGAPPGTTPGLVAPPSTAPPDLSKLRPFMFWHPAADDHRMRITTLSAPESFAIWMKASLVAGVVLSSPWVFYHIWAFVAAGLYPHEKRYVHIFLPFSLGLFLAGAATAYFWVFTPVLDFLLGFNQWLGLDPDPRISEWVSFVLLLPLGFGLSFQLPLVMLFLERIGIFNVQAYLEKWRIAVMAIFVIAALLTPADPYSMLFMALPLTFLYFGGVLLCKWMPRGPIGRELSPAKKSRELQTTEHR